MDLKEIFNRWAQYTKKKYAKRQWLLSKWEVNEGIDWPKEKIEIMLRNIISSLELNSSHTLIELGCGGGWILKALERYAKKVYGLDFAEQMLRNNTDRRYESVLVCGEMAKMPYQPESFNRVLSYFVFINVTDDRYIEQCLLEMVRVLRRDGRALIGQLPDKNRSADYDAAKTDYFRYCEKHYKIGKSIRDIYAPPLKLFDRQLLSAFLKSEGIRYSIHDSFNPFYRPGEPVTVKWRFDIVLEKS